MGPNHKRLHPQLNLKENREEKKFYFLFSEMANVKLIILFLVVIAIGLSSGFGLGKNQKEKLAHKKLESIIVKAKTAKQFQELKRQDNFPDNGNYFRPSFDDVDDADNIMARSARDIPP